MQSQRRLKSYFLMTKRFIVYPAKARFTSASIFRRPTNKPAMPNRRACAKQEEIPLMKGTSIWRTTPSSIGYITPKDMLAGHQQEIQAERDRKLEAARQQRQIRRRQGRMITTEPMFV
jgi:hypothetical protein